MKTTLQKVDEDRNDVPLSDLKPGCLGKITRNTGGTVCSSNYNIGDIVACCYDGEKTRIVGVHPVLSIWGNDLDGYFYTPVKRIVVEL